MDKAEAAAAALPRPEIDTTRAVDLVRPLLDQIKDEGAPALYSLAERYDGVRPESIRVPAEALRAALDELDPDLRAAIEISIAHARKAHEAQLPSPALTEILPGGVVHQRWVPLRRVGLYVPGGLAVYPSSVVMNVVTAQVAGVDSIVVASPPQKEFGGLPHPAILAACELLGVDEVIAAGGAGGVGALAYGFTDGAYECAPVDLVAGPGNIYVAAAKRVVQEVCGIDAEAGTTEIGILADGEANPAYVAADLISQAEHDPAAASVLITDSPELAERVIEEVDRQVEAAPARERIVEALSGPQSGIVLTDDLETAQAVMEAYAPEHLEILTKDAHDLAFRIRNAGAIFIGEYSPVPLGDYLAGSNHVLPTGGTARYASGLNVTQYLKSVQVIDFNAEALAALEAPLVTFAEAEGLPSHGAAVTARSVSLPRSAPTPAAALPLRPELAAVEPYGAPQLASPVRLNVNENPYGPRAAVADSVAQAVRAAMEDLNRYADRDATGLRQDLSDYLAAETGVRIPADQVWAANGSNEVMLQLLQAFGGPGRVAMGVAPTYSMYPEYARDTNTGWVELPLIDSPDLFPVFDLERVKVALRRYRPAVLFIPNPNNPTGMMLTPAQIRELLETAQTTGPVVSGTQSATIVVMDEAYAEFRRDGVPSSLELLVEFPHLVVSRTLSKAFAAAGLRLGYLAADRAVIREIMKVRLPYHLGALTQAAARAVLTHRDDQLAQVQQIRGERELLADWLRENGYQVAPSEANFILFGPVPDRSRVWQGLVDRGVLVRVVGPPECLRVTVGTEEENNRFREALLEVSP